MAYQNDDYQVPPPDKSPPPIPVPQTYEQAEQWITNNRVLHPECAGAGAL